MATSTEPKTPHKQIRPLRKEFWQRWTTRLVVIIGAIAAVMALAICGDPAHESWQTKTWELVHDLVIRAHPGNAHVQ
jgi:multisubunit Na+/H+ antiporter MnhB subunit